jgi:hypothetical protein
MDEYQLGRAVRQRVIQAPVRYLDRLVFSLIPIDGLNARVGRTIDLADVLPACGSSFPQEDDVARLELISVLEDLSESPINIPALWLRFPAS